MLVPSVSFILPVYNHADDLYESVASIRSQKLSDYEIIIIDDGSTDNLDEVVDILGKDKASDIVYIKNERNLGTHISRKIATLRASKDFVIYLDADDALVEGSVCPALEAMIDARANVALCRFVIDDDSKKLMSSDFLFNLPVYDDIEDNFTSTNEYVIDGKMVFSNTFENNREPWNLCGRIFETKIIKSAFSKSCDQHIVYSEDAYEWFLTLITSEVHELILDIPLYVYNYGSGGSSLSKISFDRCKKVFDDHNLVIHLVNSNPNNIYGEDISTEDVNNAVRCLEKNFEVLGIRYILLRLKKEDAKTAIQYMDGLRGASFDIFFFRTIEYYLFTRDKTVLERLSFEELVGLQTTAFECALQHGINYELLRYFVDSLHVSLCRIYNEANIDIKTLHRWKKHIPDIAEDPIDIGWKTFDAYIDLEDSYNKLQERYDSLEQEHCRVINSRAFRISSSLESLYGKFKRLIRRA